MSTDNLEIEAAQPRGGNHGVMGDQLTNLIQPFCLLPLLGITGLKVGQVLGYTAILMLPVFILCAGSLLLLV